MLKKPIIRAVIWDTGGVMQSGKRDDELAGFIHAMRPTYRTALFCRSWEDLQAALTHRWDLADAFDQLILAPVQDEAVNPQVYWQAARQLNVQPRQAVLVDTLPERVASARTAGLQAVHLRNPAQVGSELLDLLKENLM